MKSTGRSARWSVKWWSKSVHCHIWTPVWHDGNGPYITVGLYVVSIFRGY